MIHRVCLVIVIWTVSASAQWLDYPTPGIPRTPEGKPNLAAPVPKAADGKPPGNNHHQYGGNFLFCDGRTESGPATAPFSLVFTQGVVLLNP